jgi:hypothetical protein
MTGDVTWTSNSFNGTANVTGTSTLANTGVTAGTYTKVTVDAKGRVTTGNTLSYSDLPEYSGNLVFTGTGNRILGDFSNATVANRVTFQSSTTNGNTAVGVIPNGTAIRSDLILYNSPDTTNNSFLDIFCSDTQYAFSGNKAGAGTYLPMTFYTGGSERLRIDTTGNMGLNVAPYPWLGGTKVIDVGNSFAVVGQGSQAALYANSYLNQNADGVYKNNGFAANYSMQSGRHAWGIAPSGTAGGIFNFTTAMLLNNSGNLGIGTSSPTERLHVNGNVLIAGSARRILGDFSNATIANRVGFQTSTTNGATDIPVIPNGTSTNARHFYYSTNDTANASLLTAGVVGPEATFRASAVGTGTSPPMTFYTAASERMRIDTSGNVGIGTSSPSAKLHITATAGVYNATVANVGDIGGGVIIRGASSGASSRIGLFLQGSDAIGAAIASAREDPGTTWKTYLSFYTNNLTGGNVQDLQEKMRINSNGAVVLQGGDISASGVGIAFPATQSASSNANTLDDYEEGSWTPSLSGAGSPTYFENYGRYIKIGRLVTLVGKIGVTGATASSNAVNVTGLPFTAQDATDTAQRACSFISGDVQSMGPYVASAALRTDSNSLTGVRDNGSGSTVFWLYSELSSTSFEFNINLTYLATA